MNSHKLPDMEYTFSVQTKGEESGIVWTGEFIYRRPTLQERSLIETTRARMNGDLFTINPSIQDLNTAISHLKWTLKSYPEWWKDCDFGGALYDSNVVMDIYNKCIKFEAEWNKRVLGGKPEDVEEGRKDGSIKKAERSIDQPESQPG